MIPYLVRRIAIDVSTYILNVRPCTQHTKGSSERAHFMFALGCFWSRHCQIVPKTTAKCCEKEEKRTCSPTCVSFIYEGKTIEQRKKSKKKKKNETLVQNNTWSLSSWQLNEAFFTDINKSSDCRVESVFALNAQKKKSEAFATIFLFRVRFFSFALVWCKMEKSLVKRDELRLILRFLFFIFLGASSRSFLLLLRKVCIFYYII